MEFHENLKSYRNDILNLKQGHLAHLLGISQSCLSNYENGYRSYPLDILEKIGEMGNMDFHTFIDLMYPHKGRERISAEQQLLLVKEAQSSLLKGFYERHEKMLETEPDTRDFIERLSTLPKKERLQFIKDSKKELSKKRLNK